MLCLHSAHQRRKAKAAKNVFKVAADLLAMAAARQNNLQRTPCAPDSKRMLAFEAGFEYEPTEDQHSTFAEVRDDMVDGGKPMDRLICGDVGFGKTEVFFYYLTQPMFFFHMPHSPPSCIISLNPCCFPYATLPPFLCITDMCVFPQAAMRAAYRAVCNGRQVAFLAPTTVLAAQHLRTLRKRMPDVRVEMMSSLIKRTPAQKADLLEELAQGHVEVLVGTHALLSNTLRWKRLGLLVVDEEQRFGVRQKEKIKNASLAVDVLSLSATPIPRTMYMCMAGIREMSTLHTPPAGRRPVVTRVMTRDQEAIREAILVELERGGQIFYVVPRIEQVTRETQMLRELVPELRLSFGYGGLKDLEQRIVDFTLGGTDLMVSTTIMENGIDIPNVNTIIIQDTHMFGLSQLHQLRGRVGRSNVQAYALMMHPDPGLLGDDALRRLRVLQRESGLGAGFGLAKSDLELRGAGNLFGTEQKGSFGAKEMGVDMYMMVLQRAMRYLEQKAAEGEDIHDAEELIKAANLDASVLLGLSDTLDK
jgi:transcription-repair coupling factor (superfamily II helicase)